MTDPEHPEVPSADKDEAHGALMAPMTDEDAANASTKEVDADDMFNGQAA